MTDHIAPPPADRFVVSPAWGGQIITEAFASADGRLWRRRSDRSDPDAAPRFDVVRWDDIDEDHPASSWEVGDRSAPPIPESEWTPWSPSRPVEPLRNLDHLAASYAARCYGRDGDELGSCAVRVYRDSTSHYWAVDIGSPETPGGEIWEETGPYLSASEAADAAHDRADALDEE